MSLSSLFKLHAIKTESLGSIGLLTDVTPAYNLSDFVEFAAGHPTPLMLGAHMATPDIRFTTRDLGTPMGWAAGGVAGIAKDLSSGYVQLTYRKALASGTRVPNITDAHVQGRCEDNCFFYWDSIRASQGQSAELSARLVPIWDGLNDPMIFTTEPLVDTISVANTWTLGPVTLNGAAFPGVQEATWENNITLDERASDGEEFNSWVGIGNFRPVLTLRTTTLTVLETYGLRGTAINESGTVWYLRAKKKNGINETDATPKHIKFTGIAGAGIIRARQISAGLAEVTVELATPDDTATPFTVAVDQEIA